MGCDHDLAEHKQTWSHAVWYRYGSWVVLIILWVREVTRD